MHQDTRQVIFFSQAGCLLPGLLIVNFFFGWLIFKPLLWVTIELILFLLFFLTIHMAARKIKSFISPNDNSVIDIEGQVVDDDAHRQKLA
ncbi:MAG TPA: hypothetical protein PKL77_06545 [Candidatus Omnitrophota bacterium]|nr:hypothetical protein [Candidatus Omnitrophota bacterium]